MSNKREWQRHKHDKLLALEFPDGRCFVGQSKDVSLTGLFFQTTEAVTQVAAEELGTLRVTSGDNTYLFPCQVVRVISAGLVLYITDQQAKFGFALSQDIFHNLQAKEVTQKRLV